MGSRLCDGVEHFHALLIKPITLALFDHWDASRLFSCIIASTFSLFLVDLIFLTLPPFHTFVLLLLLLHALLPTVILLSAHLKRISFVS